MKTGAVASHCPTYSMKNSNSIALLSEDEKHELHKQELIPPDTCTEDVVLPLADNKLSCGPGESVLLLVPTANKSKVHLLQTALEAALGDSNLVTEFHDVPTDHQQPYDDEGTKCMTQRLRAMVIYAKEIECTFEERKIGTVIVGAVENYIRISTDNKSAADFGIVAFYNAGTGILIQGTTRGVPIELCYLAEARDDGIFGGKIAGSVTYGNVLDRYFKAAALRVYGPSLDISSNWHEVVCGRSRYCILMETCQDLLDRHKSLFEGSSGSLQIQ
jgi:hypothetical protein